MKPRSDGRGTAFHSSSRFVLPPSLSLSRSPPALQLRAHVNVQGAQFNRKNWKSQVGGVTSNLFPSAPRRSQLQQWRRTEPWVAFVEKIGTGKGGFQVQPCMDEANSIDSDRTL